MNPQKADNQTPCLKDAMAEYSIILDDKSCEMLKSDKLFEGSK